MAEKPTSFNRGRLRAENLAYRRVLVQDRRRHKYFELFLLSFLDD
nr:hypothetical protein [Candidatus Sigynarchaeota archaeon]